jgi:vacuolar-type H+-ATPase subunit I/STV1
MPEHSEASSEHALLQEITGPLATLPEDPVPVAADVDFPIVLRGYDRIAVDAYVRKTSQLVAELQATRSPEAAVRRALERVGEEVSGVLQRAHETAEQITAQSRREAEDRLEAARLEALEITASAAERVKELDAETDRVWAERLRIVEDARELARQLLALADSAAERFPAEYSPEEDGTEGELEADPTLDEDEDEDETTRVLPLPLAAEPAEEQDAAAMHEDQPATSEDEPGAQANGEGPDSTGP